MAASSEDRARTHALARVIGPWLVIVPGIVVLRASEMGALASEFFKNGLFMWFAGALLLFGGLLIIAFHQYWSSVAAAMISLFGWILALRGLVLMAAPQPVRTRRHVHGRDTSRAGYLWRPHRHWALSHLCGLARQARLTIGKEQSLSKVDDSEGLERVTNSTGGTAKVGPSTLA
jgi:hypothetical protein